MEQNGTSFLCAKSEAPAIMERLEREKAKLLSEFRQFYTGDIDVKLHEVRHVMGTSIAATLTINGESVREYDPADLCFLELNELMLKRILEKRGNGTMSCFVMNSETLAALANAVETRLNCDYNYWGFEAPASLYNALADCKTSCTYHAEEIYRRLYAVNVRAYNGRYANHEEPEGEEAPTIDGSKYTIHHPPEYREHGFAVCPWHYQLAKLLDCWLYQTAEDDTHNDPLRISMAEFRDNLYSFIVMNSPCYVEQRRGELPHSADREG